MSIRQVTVQLTAKSLLAVVEQLPPNELREFKKQLTGSRRRNERTQNGESASAESALIEATKESLPVSESRRLKRLGAKSEQQTLTEQERLEYLALAQKAEQISVRRVEALAALSKLRGQSVSEIKKEIGWKGGGDG